MLFLFSTRRPDPDKYRDYFYAKMQHKVYFLIFASIPLYVLDYYSKGRAQIKKGNHGRPPPLVVVSGETNIAMVHAAVSARRQVYYVLNSLEKLVPKSALI